MKGERDYVDYLRDIVDPADAAADFVAALPDYESLAADRRTFWAVIRALEVVARQLATFQWSFVPPTPKCRGGA